MIARVVIHADAFSPDLGFCLERPIVNRVPDHIPYVECRHLAAAVAYQFLRVEVDAVINVVGVVRMLNHRLHCVRTLGTELLRLRFGGLGETSFHAVAIGVPPVAHGVALFARKCDFNFVIRIDFSCTIEHLSLHSGSAESAYP